MKIEVKVKVHQKKESVKPSGEQLIVCVNAIPTDGQANKRVIELVAKHLGVPKSRLSIISGQKSRIKTININVAE
jgi:uncharacterized protein YggU (UPF0235/DUF167 family)